MVTGGCFLSNDLWNLSLYWPKLVRSTSKNQKSKNRLFLQENLFLSKRFHRKMLNIQTIKTNNLVLNIFAPANKQIKHINPVQYMESKRKLK